MASQPQGHSDAISYFSVILVNSMSEENNIEIGPLVSDLDIFEHMDKPYLTGNIAIYDNATLFNAVNLNGAMEVIITIVPNLEGIVDDVKPVNRRFVLDKLVSSNKVDEQGEVFLFHMIESSIFKSEYRRINKSFTGTCTSIIGNILDTIVESDSNLKDLKYFSSADDRQQMKVIVPNMSPFQALTWIKNKAATNLGHPFYLFTSLAGVKTINFLSLKLLLEAEPINDIPFTYSGPANNAAESGSSVEVDPKALLKDRSILNYEFADVLDFHTLFKDGVMAAEAQFIDVIDSYVESQVHTQLPFPMTVLFDAYKDIIEDQGGSLGPNPEKRPPNYMPSMISDDMKEDGFVKEPVRISKVVSSGAYSVGIAEPLPVGSGKINLPSYSEAEIHTDHLYKLSLKNRATDAFLKMNPITLTVNGLAFLSGQNSTTVGNIINVLFTSNAHGSEDSTMPVKDKQKSGRYLVYSARHSFRGSSYTVSLTGMKLYN